MVDSSLHLGDSSGSMLPYQGSAGWMNLSNPRWMFFGLIAASSIIFAVFLAPEKPLAEAYICQQHNSLAACAVW